MAVRTTSILGVVTALAMENVVYLTIDRLQSARLVDEELGAQLIFIVEGMNIIGNIDSVHPTGPSLQTMVLAFARCVRRVSCPREEGGGGE